LTSGIANEFQSIEENISQTTQLLEILKYKEDEINEGVNRLEQNQINPIK
jgi:hypothetical protein